MAVSIGANIGVMTLALAGAVGPRGRVISVEPMPAHAAKLRTNIAANGFRNVHVWETAVSSHDGMVGMAIDDRQEGHARVLPTASRRGVLVESTTLDGLLARSGVTHVAVCKIDVEAHEAEVFMGASRLLRTGTVAAWVFEHHLHTGGVLDVLEEYGYRVYRVWKLPRRLALVPPASAGPGKPTADFVALYNDSAPAAVTKWISKTPSS
ncbi:MAG: FkbM family methyltransferase [Planctomycetota bacterium]